MNQFLNKILSFSLTPIVILHIVMTSIVNIMHLFSICWIYFFNCVKNSLIFQQKSYLIFFGNCINFYWENPRRLKLHWIIHYIKDILGSFCWWKYIKLRLSVSYLKGINQWRINRILYKFSKISYHNDFGSYTYSRDFLLSLIVFLKKIFWKFLL